MAIGWPYEDKPRLISWRKAFVSSTRSWDESWKLWSMSSKSFWGSKVDKAWTGGIVYDGEERFACFTYLGIYNLIPVINGPHVTSALGYWVDKHDWYVLDRFRIVRLLQLEGTLPAQVYPIDYIITSTLATWLLVPQIKAGGNIQVSVACFYPRNSLCCIIEHVLWHSL